MRCSPYEAIALRLQSTHPVGRIAGPLGITRETLDTRNSIASKLSISYVAFLEKMECASPATGNGRIANEPGASVARHAGESIRS